MTWATTAWTSQPGRHVGASQSSSSRSASSLSRRSHTSARAATTGSLGTVVGTAAPSAGGTASGSGSSATRGRSGRAGTCRRCSARSARRLRPLDLVQAAGTSRQPCTSSHSAHGLVAVGRVDDDRAEQALAVGEEQRRHAEAAGGDDLVVLGAHVVVGGRVGDRLGRRAPGSRPSSTSSSSATSRPVRLAALLVQRPAGPLVPRVEQRRVLAPQQGADAHHRPAVGPLPLPRVLLALDAVDLLEAEEPPADVEPGQVADLADPPRRLVRPRAHHVEVEVHVLDRHHAHRCRSPARRPTGVRPGRGR